MSKKTVDENFLKVLEDEVSFNVRNIQDIKTLRDSFAAQLEGFAKLCKYTLAGRSFSSLLTKRHLKLMMQAANDLKDTLMKAKSINDETHPVSYDDLEKILKECGFLWEYIFNSTYSMSSLFKKEPIKENLNRLLEEIKECVYAFIGLTNERNAKVLLDQLTNFSRQIRKGEEPKSFSLDCAIEFFQLFYVSTPKSFKPKNLLKDNVKIFSLYLESDLYNQVIPRLKTTEKYGQNLDLINSLKKESEFLQKKISKHTDPNKPNSEICDCCKKPSTEPLKKLPCGHKICQECIKKIAVNTKSLLFYKIYQCPVTGCHNYFFLTQKNAKSLGLTSNFETVPNSDKLKDFYEKLPQIDFSVKKGMNIKELKDKVQSQIKNLMELFKNQEPDLLYNLDSTLNPTEKFDSLHQSAKDLEDILSRTNLNDNNTELLDYQKIIAIFNCCKTLYLNLYYLFNHSGHLLKRTDRIYNNLQRLIEEIRICSYKFIGLSNERHSYILLNKLEEYYKKIETNKESYNLVFEPYLPFYYLKPMHNPETLGEVEKINLKKYSPENINTALVCLNSTIDYGENSSLITKIKQIDDKLKPIVDNILEEKQLDDLYKVLNDDTSKDEREQCEGCGKKTMDLLTLPAHNHKCKVCLECIKNIEISRDMRRFKCPACKKWFDYNTTARIVIQSHKNGKSSEESLEQEGFYKKLKAIKIDKIDMLNTDLTTWIKNIEKPIEDLKTIFEKIDEKYKYTFFGSETITSIHRILDGTRKANNLINENIKPLESIKLPKHVDAYPGITGHKDWKNLTLEKLIFSLRYAASKNYLDPIHTSILNYPHTRAKLDELADMFELYHKTLCTILFEKDCDYILTALEPIKDSGDFEDLSNNIDLCPLKIPYKNSDGISRQWFQIYKIKKKPMKTQKGLQKLINNASQSYEEQESVIAPKNLQKIQYLKQLIDDRPQYQTNRLKEISTQLDKLIEKIKQNYNL